MSNWNDFLDHAELTDVGMRRTNNQDSYAVVMANDQQQWLETGHLFLVADGMGAHAAGELASQIAAEGIPHGYRKKKELSPPYALREAISDQNQVIHQKGEANAEFKGMGTTLSVLVLLQQGAVIGHVGDSRVYRLRGDRLDQLSFDHSLVWEMRAAGKLSADETEHLPSNIITRSLGPNATVKVDLEGPFPLEKGDTFLLCSDGLTGHVEDEEIGVIIRCLPPAEAAQVLVDLANLRGGSDNVTVLITKVTDNSVVKKSKPLKAISKNESGPKIAPILLGLSLLVTIVLAILALISKSPILGVVAGVAALVSGLIYMITKFGGEEENTPVISAGQLGAGPHTSLSCPTSAEIVAKLGEIVAELREAAAEENWAVNWEEFDALRSKAQTATAANKYSKAVRSHCRAIMFMMSELRSQQKSA